VHTADVEEMLAALMLDFRSIAFDAATVGQVLATGDPIVSEISEGADKHLLIVHGYEPISGFLTTWDSKDGYDSHYWTVASLPQLKSLRVLKVPADALEGVLLGPPAVQEESEDPVELVERILPALLSRAYTPAGLTALQTSSLTLELGVPLRFWSSEDVLLGQLETTPVGWRHILLAANIALMVVDLTPRVGGFAFKKASTGRCVKGIAGALRRLADEQPAAAEVNLIEVPCLDLHVVSYQIALEDGVKNQIMVAFSAYPEFVEGQVLAREEFVGKASELGGSKRVTNQV